MCRLKPKFATTSDLLSLVLSIATTIFSMHVAIFNFIAGMTTMLRAAFACYLPRSFPRLRISFCIGVLPGWVGYYECQGGYCFAQALVICEEAAARVGTFGFALHHPMQCHLLVGEEGNLETACSGE